ncbi:hypothetical protein O6P43_028564 [Quillaja saponaria]|uniref:Uncharacterized protein n=1 Tax=Quillaja saponaria TaxID=32244 RepID=A0AAD7KY40_QUISA|nr:hypothetical protein O6P43_028564 [Quillaja saponaria]
MLFQKEMHEDRNSMHKSRQPQGKMEVFESRNKNYSVGDHLRNSKQSCRSMFSVKTINHKLVFVLASMTLIVLLLSLCVDIGTYYEKYWFLL